MDEQSLSNEEIQTGGPAAAPADGGDTDGTDGTDTDSTDTDADAEDPS